MKEPSKEQVLEKRRLKVYKEIGKIERWEETLKTLVHYSKQNAVQAFNVNNPVGSSYYTGKADGIQELIEKVHVSRTINNEVETKL